MPQQRTADRSTSPGVADGNGSFDSSEPAVDPVRLLEQLERSAARVCGCERGDDSQRIRCFVDEYARFQARRRLPLSRNQLLALERVQHVSQLSLIDEPVTGRSPMLDLLQSAVLQEFLRCYGLRHPSFVREMPPLRSASLLHHLDEL